MPIVPAFYPIPTGWHIGGILYDAEPPDSPQLDAPPLFAAMAVRTPVFPVAAMPRPIQGFRLNCFCDDYYYRIHLIPDRIAFGSIVTETTTEFTIWNSDLIPRVMTGLDGIPDGLTITAPDDEPAPWTFAALEEQVWSITAHLEGEAALDAKVSFLFNIPAPFLHVSGNRIRAWPYLPNWTESVTEHLEWLTDVLTSTSGAEQRRALRQAPRKRYEALFFAEGEARNLLANQLSAYGGQAWILPIWPEAQFLKVAVPVGSDFIPCVTANQDFEAGRVAVLIEDTPADTFTLGAVAMLGNTPLRIEAVEVAEVKENGLLLTRTLTAAIKAGTRLYPARAARLERQPELKRHTDRLYGYEAAFEITDAREADLPAPQLPTYRAHPVCLLRPDESEDLTDGFERALNILDVKVGRTRVKDVTKRGFPLRQHRFLNANLSTLGSLKSLLYALKGRQGALWLPTHMDDMTPIRVTTDEFLWINPVGFILDNVYRQGRQDIAIWLKSGETLLRRIVGADFDGGIRLRLDPLLPRPITPREIARISYLSLMRLADDDVAIEHITGDNGISRVSLTFRGVRDDLEAE
ncbi:MAG: hypothetical protein FWH15_09510 [Betaproteobacteria bacterium]|nr:hypothetical protein [Betaproteobacteria bacterium]